jgi:hypothetical protein
VKVDSLIHEINISAIRGQIGSSANNRQPANKDAGLSVMSSARGLAVGHTDHTGRQNKDVQIKPIESELYDLKPVFAVDEDKNIVIRFLDKKGKIVRQIPPDEYLNMVKKLQEAIGNLYSKKV